MHTPKILGVPSTDETTVPAPM